MVKKIWKVNYKKDFKSRGKEVSLPRLGTGTITARRRRDPCAVSAGGVRVVVQHLQIKKQYKITSFWGRRNRGRMRDCWCRTVSSTLSGHEALHILEDGEASTPGDTHSEEPPPSKGAAEHIKTVVRTLETNEGRHDNSCLKPLIRRELTWSAALPNHKRAPGADGSSTATDPAMLPGFSKETSESGLPPHSLEDRCGCLKKKRKEGISKVLKN
ncbi:hypothetical protein RR46_14927 [Papilio xuthus]|uniref:Uncharacterized protein n=1 Tax=Papilio xuthus TaxID=66420 RepID=A0A194PEG8_PAPXU|nr:hypothetical protein RR46_14927 [Papilio xuthus]